MLLLRKDGSTGNNVKDRQTQLSRSVKSTGPDR